MHRLRLGVQGLTAAPSTVVAVAGTGWGHLARRFTGMLWPLGPGRADTRWAEATLSEGELGLWRRLGGADRRHAVAVARRVERALGHQATRPVLAAALLHDVGKLEGGLGVFGRVGATLVARFVGHDRASAWTGRSWRGRVSRYVRHPALGAGLLGAAGSDPLAVAWAREHHTPAARRSVPPDLGAALEAADDD